MSEHQDSGTQADAPDQEGAHDLPPMDFCLFLLSLNTSALMHLGEGADAAGEPNLAMARQTIEILAMLEDKTRGNLTGGEEQLLNQVLFDLRLRYARQRPST